MKKNKYFSVLLIVLGVLTAACSTPPGSGGSGGSGSNPNTYAILTGMGSGINLGNTLDATPTEGDWTGGVLAQAYYFDDYTNAGFKNVRIPVTWQYHITGGVVDPAWMARVKTVVDWALSRGLIVILNAHHENWIYSDYAGNIAQFESLWQQIAAYFSGESPNLMFEILNEPQAPMTMNQVNDMDSKILPIIRKSNPTRYVLIGPDQWFSLYELINKTNFIVPNDPYVIVTFHYYNPYNFCGNGVGTWGTAGDYSSMDQDFLNAANWSAAHNVPLYLGEYGTVTSADYQSRLKWLGNIASLCKQYGFSYAIWDDDGIYAVFNRSAGTFDNNVLAKILP